MPRKKSTSSKRTKVSKQRTIKKKSKNRYLKEGSGFVDGKGNHYIVENGKLKQIKVPPEPDW